MAGLPDFNDVKNIPDDKKCIGWSTTKNATTADDLSVVEIKSNLTYYPVIVDKDDVEYFTEYYFEDLDGNFVIDSTKNTSDWAKPTTEVTAKYLDEKDIPEGYEAVVSGDAQYNNQVLSGKVPTDSTVLTLKVYYKRKLLKVNFYDAFNRKYYNSETGEYSQPSAVVEVRYGTLASSAENYAKYKEAETTYSSNRFRIDRVSLQGFYKDGTISAVYSGEDYTHEIPRFWWYEDEDGEYKKFYVEGRDAKEDLEITSDVDVYTKAKKLTLEIAVPQISYPSVYYVYYDEDTRFFDTVKDAIFNNEGNFAFDVEKMGIEDKTYSKFEGKGLLEKVGDNYEILNLNKLIRFARLMGEEGFEAFLDSFIDEDAIGKVEEHLYNYIMTEDTDETATKLKGLVDQLVKEHKDIAKDMISQIVEHIIENEVTHVEQFFITYTDSIIGTEEKEDDDELKEMICDMFEEYKKEHSGEFVAFLTDVVVKALSAQTPNATIQSMIEDYIRGQIDAGEESNLIQDKIDESIDDVIADVIKDIKDKYNDGDDTTESEYIEYVEDYADSLTDFSDIVDAFLNADKADKAFRDSVIIDLFDTLYASDPEHEIILQFMEKLTDEMIESGDIDVNILVTIIDYIKDTKDVDADGDGVSDGHKLTNDIIENVMKLGDNEVIDYAEQYLGFEGNAQLKAALQFREQATYEEKFQVTEENLFIIDMVRDKVEEMTFEKFMEEYVYGKLSKNLIDKLPVDEIVGEIYNDSKDRFIAELDAAVQNVENGSTDEQWVHSGFIVSINPVEFAMDMYDSYLLPGYDKANDKAEALGGRISKLYLTAYRDNPYIDDLIDLTSPDLYFKGVANDSTEYTSGYHISSIEEMYRDVLMPGVVLTDDILVWYLDKVDFDTFEGFAKDNEDLILAMYNHPNVLAKRYAEQGLPETMEEYFDDLMEDDEIREAFEKIDNKISFEMEPLVRRFITNQTLEMYYNKMLEKFGVKAEDILGIYDDKDIKEEITSENYEAMLKELEEFWIDGNSRVTTDYVLDGFYHNLFSIFSFSKTFKGYTISFERVFVDF